MDCQEFLSSYTDYRDGRLSAEQRTAYERHLSDCPTCERYQRVVDEGVRTLRKAPSVAVDEDFLPRLKHRIYHLEDGEVLLSGGSEASGVTALATIGVAVLLTVAAWTPVLRQAETVRLPAIVVTGPAPGFDGADLRLPPSAFFRAADGPGARASRGAANLTWAPTGSSLIASPRTVSSGVATTSSWTWGRSASFGAAALREVESSLPSGDFLAGRTLLQRSGGGGASVLGVE